MAYRTGWTITFDGMAFRESDLTLGDTIRALEVAGGTWLDLHPLTGPKQFVGLLVAFLVSVGEDEQTALKRAVGVRFVDALDMVAAGEAVEERPQPDDGDLSGDRARPVAPEPTLTGGAAREA